MMLSNCHEVKYAKVNRTLKAGSKEEFECPGTIEFYNKIMGGVDLEDQLANVYELNRKSCKWWEKSNFFSPIDERSGQLMDCVYCELKHRTIDMIYKKYMISLYFLQKP
ncbi:rho guanine nucleotide exchange factor 10-like protein [Trichonephila clavata]|uniref:Rho guanine nucleotide exchange factor 10-like protein n=1 Tax=Trichonephila clavata TaxID=2740835 RepID=A0A8X6HVX1_TRICU|nr:rho guanine nucleotide exchange factor 10-like protein [Trichonephila clavata]